MKAHWASDEMCERVFQTLVSAPMPTSVNVRRAMPDVHSSTIGHALSRLEHSGCIKKIEAKPALYKILKDKAEVKE